MVIEVAAAGADAVAEDAAEGEAASSAHQVSGLREQARWSLHSHVPADSAVTSKGQLGKRSSKPIGSSSSESLSSESDSDSEDEPHSPSPADDEDIARRLQEVENAPKVCQPPSVACWTQLSLPTS